MMSWVKPKIYGSSWSADWQKKGTGPLLTKQIENNWTCPLCFRRLAFDSSKGTVIKPAEREAGPAKLPVQGKAFKIRRDGPDSDDTWTLTIDKKLQNGGKKVTSRDAVKNYECWIAEGFYGYKPNVKFTVK